MAPDAVFNNLDLLVSLNKSPLKAKRRLAPFLSDGCKPSAGMNGRPLLSLSGRLTAEENRGKRSLEIVLKGLGSL